MIYSSTRVGRAREICPNCQLVSESLLTARKMWTQLSRTREGVGQNNRNTCTMWHTLLSIWEALMYLSNNSRCLVGMGVHVRYCTNYCCVPSNSQNNCLVQKHLRLFYLLYLGSIPDSLKSMFSVYSKECIIIHIDKDLSSCHAF